MIHDRKSVWLLFSVARLDFEVTRIELPDISRARVVVRGSK